MATGELSLLVVAGVAVAHQLCKAGVRGSIPLVSTTLTRGNADRQDHECSSYASWGTSGAHTKASIRSARSSRRSGNRWP